LKSRFVEDQKQASALLIRVERGETLGGKKRFLPFGYDKELSRRRGGGLCIIMVT